MKTKYSNTLIWGFYLYLLIPSAHAQSSRDGDAYGYDPNSSRYTVTVDNTWYNVITDKKLDFFYEFIKPRLNCQKLGTIVSFDSATQTASVRISHKILTSDLDPDYRYNYDRYISKADYDKYLTKDSTARVRNVDLPHRRMQNPYVSEPIDYPLLTKVPVFIPAGGNAFLTMPVKPGDPCIVIFSDVDISEWLNKGKTDALPPTERKHDMRDAFAIVGFRPMTNPISNYNADDAELRNAGAKIVVGADSKISIRNEKESLHDALTELVKCLKEFTVTETGTASAETTEKLKEIETKLNALLK